jgi:Cdc6-like AAA superfamily ATPase
MSKKIPSSLNLSDITSLVTLVSKIIEKLGFKDVGEVNEFMLSAIEVGTIKDRNYKFVCTLSELNGKVETIKDLIIDNFSVGDNIVVVSAHKKKISKYFKEWLIEELKTDKVEFWDEEDIIQSIENQLPEYWGHNDIFLKSFEDSFVESLESNGELQQALKLDKKFEDLLDVFVKPKIFYLKEDKETTRTVKVKFKLEDYLDGRNFFISGDAGTGKTTLLKEIGKLALEHNKDSTEKILPIRIKTNLVSTSNYSFKDAVSNAIKSYVGEESTDKVFKDYNVLLLIDSIDEFDDEKQKNLFVELNEIVKPENIRFILATRNYENLIKGSELCDHLHTMISNFDLNQVKQYLSRFFQKDLKKSEELWESLQDNKILERIPSTPLTISLVSVLYEEDGYEIPATITDVYDNFNTFLLGRLNVNSNLDFLKISMKEKILQMYALSIIKDSNRKRKTEQEFIDYVVDYFKEQSITIADGVIPELLKSLTDGTGVLMIDEQGFAAFQHDHFMEYYASREIFEGEDRIEMENEIIEKFTEFNWQNTAVFYTGRTKNMKKFLDKLVERVMKYQHFHEHLLAVSGMGFVLQSLWMTDSENRKDAVIASLDLMIKADAAIKLMVEQKIPFLKGIKDTDIAMAHLTWFYVHFNSITLKDPLVLAFDELHAHMKDMEGTLFERDRLTTLYQLFCVASTLNTGRVSDTSKLDILYKEDGLLTNPLFVYLFNESIDVLEYTNEAKIRKNFKVDSKKKKYLTGIRFLLDNPTENLLHTSHEALNPIKDVEIFTEGKTDASIFIHAYRILTMGDEPYWSVTAVENVPESKAGGARELAVQIKNIADNIKSDFDKRKTIIAVFDNDEKGFQEFNGLPNKFVEVNGILKKVDGLNIYALLLPIPDGDYYKPYHQEKQAFKFFEIEHYFPMELLSKHNMVKPTSIPRVNEIKDGKNDFKQEVLKLRDADLFKEFISFFRELDSIAGKGISYIE